MATLFHNLRYPPRHEGPTDRHDFLEGYYPKHMEDIRDSAISSVAGGLFAAFAVGVPRQSLPLGILVFLGAFWLFYSGVFFLTYAASCCDYGGKSLMWLPWRQRWPLVFVAVTLPWLPFWVLSALRLVITWRMVRPERI